MQKKPMKKAYSIQNRNSHLIYLFNSNLSLEYNETVRTVFLPIFKKMEIKNICFYCDTIGIDTIITTENTQEFLTIKNNFTYCNRNITLNEEDCITISFVNRNKYKYKSHICIAMEYKLC